MNTLTKLSALLYAWILSTGIAAQPTYDIQEFGVANGLPARTVLGSITDNQGFRWLGTEGGLCRFDGRNFVTFPQEADVNFQGQSFDGPLYLDRYNRIIAIPLPKVDSVEVFNLLDFKVAKSLQKAVNKKTLAGQHVHYFGQHQSDFYQLRRKADSAFIYRFDEEMNWQLDQKLSGLSTYLTDQRDQLLYTDDTGYLLFYDAGKNAFQKLFDDQLTVFPGPGNATIIEPVVHRDALGNFWVLDSQRRRVYHQSAGERTFLRAERMEALIPDGETWWNRIWEDQTGHLIFSAGNIKYRSAMVRVDADNSITDLKEILERESKITSVSGYDFTKLIELTTFAGYYTVKTSTIALPLTNYLDTTLQVGDFGAIMRGFTETPDGTVYTNTEGNRWFQMQHPDYQLEDVQITGNDGRPLQSSTSCGGNLIPYKGYVYGLSCRQDTSRTGWIDRYDPASGNWQHFMIPEENAFGRFLLLDKDGSMILFVLNRKNRRNNVYRFYPQNGNFELIAEVFADEPERSKRGAVGFALLDTINGGIWMTTAKGLHYFNPDGEPSEALLSDQKNRYVEVSLIPYPGGKTLYLSDLELMPDGKLLIASSNGLLLFDPEARKFKTVGFHHGSGQFEARERVVSLPNNFIAGIQRLNERFYLITTYNGMVVMDWKTRQSYPYNVNDGLPSNEFNRLATYVNQYDQVFIGGINGFSRIAKNKLIPAATGPIPSVSRLFTSTRSERKEKNQFFPNGQLNRIALPADLVYLGLELALPSQENPGGGTFQTWLEGFELDYGPITKSGQLKYDLLPAGDYTLHVRGFTADGQQSQAELTLPIRVRKPWYLRPWFLIGSQLLLLGLVYLIYRRRVRRIEQAAAEKQKADRQLVELELKILRQQLNPHFIFNALGAIQHFIQQQNSKVATEYLADFAKLMRMFLESSKQSFIFIRDEVELIRLYTSLEQLRFNQRFDVHFEVDEDIDQDMEDIPSLLLQPFVENAINHGLFHLKERGELTVTINRSDNDEVICQVMDNGIGRKRAGELQQNSYRKHKSRATQIVAERLSIFEQSGGTELTITTEDMYPEREFTGTKVTIVVKEKE